MNNKFLATIIVAGVLAGGLGIIHKLLQEDKLYSYKSQTTQEHNNCFFSDKYNFQCEEKISMMSAEAKPYSLAVKISGRIDNQNLYNQNYSHPEHLDFGITSVLSNLLQVKTANFTIQKLMENRHTVTEDVYSDFQYQMRKQGIEVVSIAVEQITMSF
jgi:hypothetical protein